MRYLLTSLLIVLAGCGGGDGGDDDTMMVTKPTPVPTPNPYTITCEHNGEILTCNEEDSCIRDQSQTENLVAMEEVTPEPTATPMAPAPETVPPAVVPTPEVKPLHLYRLLFSSGAITIIAECGANVNLTVNESTSNGTVQ